MVSVTLQLHLAVGKSTVPHAFALKVGNPHTSPGESLTFKATELVHRGYSQVFKGLLSGGEYLDMKVVCKLAPNTSQTYKRFRHEAEVYQNRLHDMQGYYIPRFYGLYSGSIGEEAMACLILEDCGTSITTLSDLSMEWRIKTVEVMLAIHERNIQHNDFHARNIVVDDAKDPQRLVIIDFEYAEEHRCERRYQVALYDLPPDVEDFGCDELFDVAELTEVWTPRTIEFFGDLVPVNQIAAPEDLVRWAPSQEGLFEPDTVLQAARRTLHRYLSAYADRRPYILGEKYKALRIAM